MKCPSCDKELTLPVPEDGQEDVSTMGELFSCEYCQSVFKMENGSLEVVFESKEDPNAVDEDPVDEDPLAEDNVATDNVVADNVEKESQEFMEEGHDDSYGSKESSDLNLNQGVVDEAPFVVDEVPNKEGKEGFEEGFNDEQSTEDELTNKAGEENFNDGIYVPEESSDLNLNQGLVDETPSVVDEAPSKAGTEGFEEGFNDEQSTEDELIKKGKPLEEGIDENLEPDAKGAFTKKERPLEQALNENLEPESNDFNEPAFSEQMPPPPAGVQDFSEVEAYGNAHTSAAKGFLRYDIFINGLDSKEIEEEVLSVLEDPRFNWDAKEILKSQNAGSLTIKNLNPIKAMCLVSELSFLSVDLSWKQYMALDAFSATKKAETDNAENQNSESQDLESQDYE